ncbi:MAG: DUF4349 domain-containing protein [Firmicutes bacterium]|nr:DUF4349 domain-containing protein [Bacillota bacterium]
MKQKRIAAGILVLVLLLAVLTGCNGKKSSQAADSGYWAAGDEEISYTGMFEGKNDYAVPAEAPAAMEDSYYAGSTEYDVAESEPASQNVGSMVNDLTYGENVKLIFRAWMNLQTLDFAQAESELNKLVEQYKGYFESVYTDNGSYWSNSNYLHGSYTVRVPAENYDKFLSAIGNTCHVVSLNKTTEDIGLQYSDTQMRLETMKAKQERLLALLKQATEMSDIIELESAISDCQYQIDSLTSTMNRYDSLIGYSTVNIELEQVERLDNSIVEEPTFWEKLGRNFKEGLEDFAYGVEDLIIWIAYNIVGIIIFVVIIVLIVKLWKKHAAGKVHLPKRHKKGEAVDNGNTTYEQVEEKKEN